MRCWARLRPRRRRVTHQSGSLEPSNDEALVKSAVAMAVGAAVLAPGVAMAANAQRVRHCLVTALFALLCHVQVAFANIGQESEQRGTSQHGAGAAGVGSD